MEATTMFTPNLHLEVTEEDFHSEQCIVQSIHTFGHVAPVVHTEIVKDAAEAITLCQYLKASDIGVADHSFVGWGKVNIYNFTS